MAAWLVLVRFLLQADPSLGGTYPNGINDSNEVVGYFFDSGNVPHGFLKDEDDFTILGPAGSTYTFATDVNDREEIVGWYTDTNGNTHGFVEKHGKYTTVDYPNSVQTLIWGTIRGGTSRDRTSTRSGHTVLSGIDQKVLRNNLMSQRGPIGP